MNNNTITPSAHIAPPAALPQEEQAQRESRSEEPLRRARLILEGVRQSIAAASPRERRSSWFKLQLAAEARALAEVRALEKGGAQ